MMELSFDVVFAGGGPSSIAGALHLRRLAKSNPALSGISVVVVEKAPGIGDHSLSGAAFDPSILAELLSDDEFRDLSFATKVTREDLYYLTRTRSLASPIVPPPLSNRGNLMVSLSELVRWLSVKAEAEGVEFLKGEAVDELLFDDAGAVCGVRIKGKGLDKEGVRKPNYLPPTDIGCRLVILGEGCRGHLTKRLVQRQGLDNDRIPQGHAMGLKELWEVPEERCEAGRVITTIGYPLGLGTLGGGFVYHLKDRCVALGIVVSLDYQDPRLHPFEIFQRWKMHPLIARTIDGGRLLSYGSRTIAEGGWNCIPRCFGDGFLLIGESAGLLDSQKLKGIDLAITSGMLAAETAAEALLAGDTSARRLAVYESRIRSSRIGRQLRKIRNFHQGFHRGFIRGVISAALSWASGGRGLRKRIRVPDDAACTHRLAGERSRPVPLLQPDGIVTFDKLTCVAASGTRHEENQPSHILIDDIDICNGKCREEYGNPCQFFCPANVFEMVTEGGVTTLRLNPSNCLHCKTCDIKDPYGIVTWVPPEGGGGPNYRRM